jgi:glucosamine--fructose-6-phosphate aminotransferase (isomerizing)
MGHTRWATHGRPSETNAHPHLAGDVALVHNGIIENYLELREELLPRATPSNPRPTPSAWRIWWKAMLITAWSLPDALRQAVSRIRGSFALVVLDRRSPGYWWARARIRP